MSFFNAVFIYILLWWLTLFAVLPFGIERHDEHGKGFDAGAPKIANLKKKLVINSVVALMILAFIEILIRTGVIQWREWFG